jgi:rhodanese-related sulfurtransferase
MSKDRRYSRHVIHSLSPNQAQELLSRKYVDVVDVRDAHEWSSGHLPGARFVSLDQLKANPKAALHRDGVMFVCSAGIRSQTAARIAAAAGLTEIYNLSGGTRGSSKAGLPLIDGLSVAV